MQASKALATHWAAEEALAKAGNPLRRAFGLGRENVQDFEDSPPRTSGRAALKDQSRGVLQIRARGGGGRESGRG